jgi:hypothetical protein
MAYLFDTDAISEAFKRKLRIQRALADARTK